MNKILGVKYETWGGSFNKDSGLKLNASYTSKSIFKK